MDLHSTLTTKHKRIWWAKFTLMRFWCSLSTGSTRVNVFLFLRSFSIAVWASLIAQWSIGCGIFFCTRSSTSSTVWGWPAHSTDSICMMKDSMYDNASSLIDNDGCTCFWTWTQQYQLTCVNNTVNSGHKILQLYTKSILKHKGIIILFTATI